MRGADVIEPVLPVLLGKAIHRKKHQYSTATCSRYCPYEQFGAETFNMGSSVVKPCLQWAQTNKRETGFLCIEHYKPMSLIMPYRVTGITGDFFTSLIKMSLAQVCPTKTWPVLFPSSFLVVGSFISLKLNSQINRCILSYYASYYEHKTLLPSLPTKQTLQPLPDYSCILLLERWCCIQKGLQPVVLK